MPTPLKLFISYAHKDEAYLEELQIYLTMLKREGKIEVWTDEALLAGQAWDDKIKANLENADIIVMLVSQPFIASGYITDVEVKKAIERYNKGENVIIPIIIRPCEFSHLEISKFQALPKSAKPISTWDNQDEAWLDVSKQIRVLVENLLEKKNKAEITGIETQTESSTQPNSSANTQAASSIDKDALRKKVARGNVKDVIQELLDYTASTNEDIHNAMIMLSSSYESNQKNELLGIVSADDTRRNNAQITYRLLQYIDEVK